MGAKSFAIHGQSSPASINSFALDPQSVYVDNVPTPAGRVNANGGTQIALTQVGLFVGGRGGDRTMVMHAGGGSTGGTFVAAASNAATQYGNDQGSVAYIAGGTPIRVQFDIDGGFYYGHSPASGQTITGTSAGTLQSNRTLAGAVVYCEAPSQCNFLNPTIDSSTQVTLSWAAPIDDGCGVGFTGYKVRYSTDPTFATGVTVVDATTTSKVITGLTPGATYYFQAAARNFVTDFYGTWSAWSPTASASLGSAPGAPTALALTPNANGIAAAWTAPASDGGSPILDYKVDYSTDSTFATGVTTLTASGTSKTITGLTPGTTYYVRVKARNLIGTSAASSTANAAALTRGVLDLVAAASVHVGDTQVAIRSDGANAPTLTLGYTVFGTGTTFTSIAALPVGTSAGQFAANGSTEHGLVLVADASGNLYVIGRDGSDPSTVLVKRYAKTGPTTWTASGTLSQALSNTGDILAQFAAAYVPGTGTSPVPVILVLTRRAGTVGTNALSFAVLDLNAIAASSGALFLSSGSDPAWLPGAPTGQTPDTGVLDLAALVPGGTRLAALGNGVAVIDITNGAISGVAKSANGTSVAAARARILGINAGAFAVLMPSSGALAWTFYNTSAAVIGSGTYAGANALGGAFSGQWDAYYDRVAQLVTAYYIADDSARKLESIDISPVTYAATAATVLTSALGAASSTNGEVRVPSAAVDERRVIVEADNLLTGAKSTALYVDTSGNVTPSAPTLVDEPGYDATSARVFAWVFGDSNPLDTQVTYDFQIQRVSDSVNVVDVSAVASAASLRNVAGGTLANGVNYRWRVRVTDALGAQSAWSSYDTFTTSALGTLTITSPAADNPAGLDSSSLAITWSYSQANGYVQTQRRVRVIRLSDSAVLSDTTMQASTSNTYTVTGLPTDVPVRIEVSIVTNAPGTPTVGPVNRLVTTSYGTPMTPVVLLTAGVSYIEVDVTNPTPSGSRPEVDHNIVERRPTGSSTFTAIAIITRNGTYRDHAVASGRQYDYRVRGVTA